MGVDLLINLCMAVKENRVTGFLLCGFLIALNVLNLIALSVIRTGVQCHNFSASS
ncbi:hypothetical protein XIS1_660014 [Xenorhabdus innexi]|uniref:Uncharacterized protein n=1 Tax=Xenorhabdus innexi TaxID=290109 RepID=A0A1N6N0C6_9GAMM|nr:hypothetical protein Xinn_00779 [Xenorhabdus innexi]SIP74489.1 hypothetical protein XIS1_660014 [Xenorhabdus innexi]